MANLLAVLVFPLAVLSIPVDEARFTLDQRRKYYGDIHEFTFRAIDDLAQEYSREKQYAEAEPLYIELLEGRRRLFGNHSDTRSAMNDLALNSVYIGKLVQAEELYRQALEHARQNGNATRETCRQLYYLAVHLGEQGDFAESEALFQESLACKLLNYGKEDYDTLLVMNGLAVALYFQGNYSEAQRLGRETLRGARRKFGDRNEFTVLAMTNLAEILSYGGRNFDADAETLFRIAFEIYRHGTTKNYNLEAIQTMCSLTRLYERKPYEKMLLWEKIRQVCPSEACPPCPACPVCEACLMNYTQPVNASRAETEDNDSAKGFTDSYVFYFCVFVGCVTAFYLASFLGWAEYANYPLPGWADNHLMRKLLVYFQLLVYLLLMVFIHLYYDTFSCEEFVLAPKCAKYFKKEFFIAIFVVSSVRVTLPKRLQEFIGWAFVVVVILRVGKIYGDEFGPALSALIAVFLNPPEPIMRLLRESGIFRPQHVNNDDEWLMGGEPRRVANAGGGGGGPAPGGGGGPAPGGRGGPGGGGGGGGPGGGGGGPGGGGGAPGGGGGPGAPAGGGGGPAPGGPGGGGGNGGGGGGGDQPFRVRHIRNGSPARR